MKVAELQLNQWDRLYDFIMVDFELNPGDYVLVEIAGYKEIGKVLGIKEVAEDELKNLNQQEDPVTMIRKANLKDLEQLEANEKNREAALEVCRKLVEKNQLPMKMIDAHFSFDNKKITFAFIADGRIDFRGLVKDLTRHFQSNIRLQQLGVRDEAKINGDIGSCGIAQCCKTHLRVLGNVNADQAELQQVSHRGAERLSGICGRLKCCLRYENELYKELSERFPAIGSLVKTPRGKGEIVEWHILKQTVMVKLEQEEGSVVEVPLEKVNK